MIIIKDVQSFLEDKNYRLIPPNPKSKEPIWVAMARPDRFEEYLGENKALEPLLILMLNHWLSGELGRHWQKADALFNPASLHLWLGGELAQDIDRAVIWYWMLKKAATNV